MTDTKPVVSLDLDALEREDADAPYPVRFGGKVYDLQDPKELDYRDLINAFRAADNGHPEAAVDIIVAEDQRESFFANPLPSWKLEKLFQGYVQHFGLTVSGKAPGASRSSSRGTAGRSRQT